MTNQTQTTATNNTEKNPIHMGHYSTTPNTNMRQQSNFRHWYQTPGIMMQGLISTLRTLGQFTVANKHRKPALYMRWVFVLLMMSSTCVFAQVDVTSSGGTLAASYTTLKGAFDAINAGTHTGTIAIGISGNTTETASAALNASGSGSASYTTISIQPTGGAVRSISGAMAAAAPLVNLNGADNVTIDGLNTGGNSLTFSNTGTGSTAGTSTIQFIADATNNIVTNCTVLGSSTSTLGTGAATIVFRTATTTGNDNNTISNCNIGPAGASLPSKAICGIGTTTSTATCNSGIIISNNNIFDYFIATTSCSGINMGVGNDSWTVSNNRIYQTAARVFTTTALRYSGISINGSNSVGSTHTITGNVIGFGAANGTGTTTISGSTNEFRGIDINAANTTTLSSVQGNTISGINQTSSRSSTTLNLSPFIGIATGTSTVDAPANIGNITGNTIGSLDGSSTIVVAASSTTTGNAPVMGILDFNFQSLSISNNNIGSITINNGGAGTTVGFRGIMTSATTAITRTMNNNTVGGTATGSITNNIVGNYSMYGIQITGPNVTATNNIVRNMSGNANGAVVVMSGMIVSGSTGANTYSRNTVHSLSNTVTGGSVGAIYALDFALSTAANIIERNLVHSISVTSTLTAYQIVGIQARNAGTTTYKNNMVRLGIDAAGSSITGGFNIIGIVESAGATNNFYHNSVYVGGSGVTAASNTFAFSSAVVTNTRAFQNNIFWNARSNASGAGKNYAISVAGTAPNPAGLTINYNDYLATGTGGVFGLFNAADVANLSAWKTAVGQDVNSYDQDPQFLNATGSAAVGDLHIHPTNPTIIEGQGLAIGSVTDDYDGQTRSGLTPTDIGADALDAVPVPLCSGTPASTTVTGATSVCSGTGTTLSLANTYTDLGIIYQWASSTTSGSGYTNLGTGATQATGNLSVTTYYIATITCTNGGGSFTTPEFTVNINALPTVGVNPTSGTYCSPGGTAVTLNGTGATSYTWSPAAGLSATTGTTVNASPPATTIYTVTGTDGNGCTNTATATITVAPKPTAVTVTPASTAICLGATQALTASGGTTPNVTSTLGAGTSVTTASTTASTLGPNPLQSYYGGSKQQIIVLASELTGLGLVSGSSISAIAFNMSSTESRTLQNYVVKMQHTALSAFASTSFVTSGFATVRNAANITAVPGWNTIAFNTNFVWNGTDNLLIETNQSNNDAGGSGTNLAIYSTTAFASTLFYRVDNATAAAVDAATTASFAAYTQRNNIQFTFNNLVQGAFTWSSSPETDLDTYSGPNVIAQPTTAVPHSYIATATLGACSSQGSATLTVNPLPAVTLVTGGAAYCTGSTPANIEAAVTGTGPWTVSYTLDGNPLTANGATSPISLGNAAGVYVVTGITDANCSNTASGTQTISFDIAPTANAGADIASCVSGSPVFTVTGVIGGSATTATWSTDGGGSFSTTTWDGLGQTYTPAGSDLAGPFPKLITITLTTNASGACPPAVDNLVITLNQVPDLVTTPASFCSGGNVDLSTLVTDNNSTTGTLAYYPTLTDAQNETAAISSVVTTAGTYYIRKNTSTTPSCSDIESVVVTQLADYTITATAGANGSITPSGITTVCSGGSQLYTFTPAACYQVLDITIDGVPQGPGTSYSFTNVTANHTIDVTFAIIAYTLTYTAGPNGSITGISPQTVNCGSNGIAVTAVADPGYHFLNWSDASIDNPRTDMAVNADITVTANFQINCPAVAHNVNQNSDHCTIQDAVDAANAGDVINIIAGTFVENVLVNEEVTLNGAGSGLTKVTSVTANGDIMTVTANNVTISNMQLEGSPDILGNSATRGIYMNSAISNLHVTNVLSSLHQYAMFADNSADVNGLVVLNSTFTASGNGIQVQHTGKVAGLSITGGAITNNFYGLSSNAQYQVASVNVNNQTGLTGVTVTGTVFSGNQYKGLYFEKLDNATFDNITVTGNGTANTGFLQESGFDINLKFGTYTDIEILNSEISGNAINNDNGAGLAVKARTVGGGGTYALNPATLTNVSIHHNNVTNNGASGLYTSGIRIGESNNSVTGVGETGPTGVEIHYNGITGNTNFAIRNASTASVNATCNWFGTNDLPTITGMLSMSPGTITYIPHLTSGDNDIVTGGFQTSEVCLACDPIVAGTYGPVCIDAADITLVGSPAGGVWTGTGVSGDQINGYTFDPSAGTQTLTYTYDGLNGCSGTDVTLITVNPLPVVSFTGLSSAYCVDAASVTLTGNQTPNGTFSGAGITDNGDGTATFSPAAAGAGGPYNITYSYTDGNGCSNSSTQTVTVNALPVVSFTGLAATYCVSSAPVTLTGNQAPNGTFTGPGITDNADGTASFNPATAGAGGPYNITYSYTDGNGCSNSSTQTVTVNALPVVSFTGLPANACTAGGTVTLTGNLAPDGTFSGAGITDNGDGTATFDPAVAGPGTHSITYSYTDGNTCSNSSSQSVVVFATPAAPSIGVVNNHDGTSTLTATGVLGGASLLWSTTQTVNPIVVNATGTYTVTQTLNGCTSAAGSVFVVPDIFADPAITGLDLTDLSDVSISANSVGYNQVVKLKIPVFNLNQDNFLPAGSTTLRVDLGSKFIVDPGFNLATAPLSAYFTWTSATEAGHIVIYGAQHTQIPADFADMAVFQIQATTSCTSTINANFMVDNHLSTVFLIDDDNANNIATLQYTVIVPAPTLAPIIQPNCATATGTITITAPTAVGMTYSITGVLPYTNTTGVFTGVAPGPYNVTAQTADGCFSAATVAVVNAQPVTPTIVVTNIVNNTCHGGLDGSITVVASVAPTPYEYTIISGPTINASGLTSGIFTGLAAGNYVISVTSVLPLGSGCSNTTTAVVTEPGSLVTNLSLGSDYSANMFAAPGAEVDVVYNVAEIDGNPAVGDTLRISKVAGYSITFDGIATAITVGSTNYTLDNTRWTVDNSNPSFVSLVLDPPHTGVTPGVLNCQQIVYLSIKFTRNTPNISTFALSARLRKANGETNLTNNLNSIVFTAE